jgi:hypothetical protein
MTKKQLVQKYWTMPLNELPRPLFWYVQGYCAAVGGCGDVIHSAIEDWLKRKKKNRVGTE